MALLIFFVLPFSILFFLRFLCFSLRFLFAANPSQRASTAEVQNVTPPLNPGKKVLATKSGSVR